MNVLYTQLAVKLYLKLLLVFFLSSNVLMAQETDPNSTPPGAPMVHFDQDDVRGGWCRITLAMPERK